jgi:hypothetical protein
MNAGWPTYRVEYRVSRTLTNSGRSGPSHCIAGQSETSAPVAKQHLQPAATVTTSTAEQVLAWDREFEASRWLGRYEFRDSWDVLMGNRTARQRDVYPFGVHRSQVSCLRRLATFRGNRI